MAKIFKKIKDGNKRTIYFLGVPVCSYRKKGLEFKDSGQNVVIMKHHRIYFKENISLGNNVRIGTRVFINAMGGLTIGNNVIFGPDVTILKDVPKGAVVGGNPAKILKHRNIEQYEKLKQEQSFRIFNK